MSTIIVDKNPLEEASFLAENIVSDDMPRPKTRMPGMN